MNKIPNPFHIALLMARSVSLAFVAALMGLSAFGQTVISDPVGDASGHHDAIAISGGYNATDLFLSASFAPGTLDTAHLGFIFGLDTDENPATGNQSGFFPLGAEFSLGFNSVSSTSAVNVFKFGTGSVGTVPVSFGIDMLSLTVPLSLLNNDDGAMNFGFIVGVPTDASSFEPFDVVPDSADGGPLGGPTTPVPEPSTYGLLMGGLLLFGMWWRFCRNPDCETLF